MVARPGTIKPVFNAGEVTERFDERPNLKAFSGGLAYAENVELLPQGGFGLKPGLRHVGDVAATAARLVPFTSNAGNVYDLVFNATQIEVWGETAKLHQFNHPYSAAQVSEFLWDQSLDTLITFHEDVAPWRALTGGPTTWTTGSFPLSNLPLYDYGGAYVNGVASEWELDFIGFNVGTPTADGISFAVTVNGVETPGLYGTSTSPPSGTTPDMTAIAADIQAAVLALPGVNAGVTCVVTASGNPYRCKIVFGGAGNLGDLWTVSVRIINKTDAAILSNKIVTGVSPGEDIISVAKGWPRCGRFYQQRLLLGGLKSLPGSWMASQSGNYSQFDTRVKTADGPFVAALDLPGGERVENLVDNRFLLVQTSDRNYWIAGSASGLSKTAPPVHVPASDHGVAAHVPVAANEGAVIYIHKSGDFLGEMRYTDVDGNYATQDLSLLAPHLLDGVKDLAVRRKEGTQSANRAVMVNGDGSLRCCYLLREQELTGFVRVKTDGLALAAQVNGRNEESVIMDRPRAGGRARTLERFEPGLLLDGAIDINLPFDTCTIAGLGIFEGCEVWALAEGDVQGPFCVKGGMITLGKAACTITVGRWLPPRVTTLPLPREIGPNIWLQKKARIHSVQVFVEDTTSLAIEINGRVYDQPLRRFGDTADVPELEAGYTGLVTVRGLTGYVDQPRVTITQVRPGRLTVRSMIIEASLS